MKKTSMQVLVLVLLAVLVASGCGGGSGGKATTPTPSAPAPSVAKYQPPHSRPGPAVDRLTFSSHYVDQALVDLAADKMDLYAFSLKITAARELEKNTSLKSYRAPASTVSILLNPAPGRSGTLNPFSLPDVRRAVHYLVDRKSIAGEIYGGFAVPQIAHLSALDYDYLTIYDIVAKWNIRHDPDYAKAIVVNAMKEAGAELVAGKWHYSGRPIRVKFVIRVEDERRDVGDMLKAALEEVGFTVDPLYKTFAAAIFSVYTSDPQAFEWHLYTEGWGRGATEKYDFATINQMAAPWMGNMPGWQIVGFWQYASRKLDELGKALFTGAFVSKEKRDEIYREMTELLMKDSVRIWVATVFNTFPAKLGVTGVTEDLVAGPTGVLALREAYVPGKEALRIGNLWVWTERSVWNPVAGMEDVYSTSIWKNLYDPAIISHPFTGLPIEFRAGFRAETAGPQGKMKVPQEASTWNAAENRWQNVSEGTEATSKVTFDFSKYFQSRWHHGQPITMADVIYGIASMFERTYDPDKARIEFVLAASQRPILDVFKGFRVLDENRLEVYLDYWHFESAYIASYASLTSLPLPWEIMAASDELVFAKRQAAYSKSAASRYNVPWLSLVMKQDAVLVALALKDFRAKQSFPADAVTIGGVTLVNAEEAQARYQAALDWFEKYSHLVISQGPFMLTRYDPPAQYAELFACHVERKPEPVEPQKPQEPQDKNDKAAQAEYQKALEEYQKAFAVYQKALAKYEEYQDKCADFGITNYPFKPGDWYMPNPEALAFTNVDVPRISPAKSNTVTVKLGGPGELGLYYYIVDPTTGTVEAVGSATRTASGEFLVELDVALLGRLRGKYLDLYLLAYSDSIALVKERYVQISVP